MNFGLQRMSASSLALLFVAFSATMGASLSSVFLVYSLGSLTQVFGITAGTFLVMSIIGYTTSTDLSRFGSILHDGLGGHPDRHGGQLVPRILRALDFGISVLGVLIFTGLIAYDTQKLKRIAAGVEYGSEHGPKVGPARCHQLIPGLHQPLFVPVLRLLGRRD